MDATSPLFVPDSPPEPSSRHSKRPKIEEEEPKKTTEIIPWPGKTVLIRRANTNHYLTTGKVGFRGMIHPCLKKGPDPIDGLLWEVREQDFADFTGLRNIKSQTYLGCVEGYGREEARLWARFSKCVIIQHPDGGYVIRVLPNTKEPVLKNLESNAGGDLSTVAGHMRHPDNELRWVFEEVQQ